MRHYSITFAASLALAGSAVADLATFSGTGITSTPLTNTDLLRIVRTGSVTSQGDAAMNAPLVRDPVNGFGVTGSGIKVGIISDSFNALGGMAAGVSSGNLPAGVTIVKDDTGTDEGRGMAEIVHDVAPGAQILFHSAFNNTFSGPGVEPSGYTIAQAINNLVSAGADIIVDDVGLLTQPAFQLDAAAVAIRNAKNAGVAYFTAAGNAGTEAYQGTYRNLGGVHNFDDNNSSGGDQLLDISVPANSTVRVQLHWSDAYASLGGTAASDMLVAFFNSGGTQVGTTFNLSDATSLAVYTNNTASPVGLGIAVQQLSGSANELIRVTSSVTITDDDDTNSATIFGHQLSEDGVSVAAHRYSNLTSVEGFSSRGPGVLLFDETGNPIFDPLDLPRLTGPNGGNTSFFGFDDGDPDAFPNFFGTSAAAPHVAAVAALMLERAQDLGLSLSVDDIYNILFSTAVDIGAPGFDNASGYGRVDAFAAVSAVPEPTIVSLAGLGMVFVLGRRRRAA